MTIPIPYPPWFGAKLVDNVRPLTRKDRDFSSEYAPLRYNSVQLKTIGFFKAYGVTHQSPLRAGL